LDKGDKMGWRNGGARRGARISVGKALLDARVMTMRANGVELFTNFIHEPAMERPGATRGGKRKPFLEVFG